MKLYRVTPIEKATATKGKPLLIVAADAAQALLVASHRLLFRADSLTDAKAMTQSYDYEYIEAAEDLSKPGIVQWDLTSQKIEPGPQLTRWWV